MRQRQHARTADWLWQSEQRGQGTFTGGYPCSVPTDGLYTPAACWKERIASREGLQTRGPASRGAASGRGEDDLPTRQRLLLIVACQPTSQGKDGRR